MHYRIAELSNCHIKNNDCLYKKIRPAVNAELNFKNLFSTSGCLTDMRSALKENNKAHNEKCKNRR